MKLLPPEIRKAARAMSRADAQALVLSVLEVQHIEFAVPKEGTPSEAVFYLYGRLIDWRKDVLQALEHWLVSSDTGIWLRSIKGLSLLGQCGFGALLEVTDKTDIELMWKRCALDPVPAWENHRKEPSNPLKALAIAAADGFAKLARNPISPYGTVYRLRMDHEIERLRREPHKGIVYSNDRRADLIAKRVAVKLFLAHYQQVAFYTRYGRFPDFPWRILLDFPGAPKVEIPNIELLEEMQAALAAREAA
jgi:hypothetical protein